MVYLLDILKICYARILTKCYQQSLQKMLHKFRLGDANKLYKETKSDQEFISNTVLHTKTVASDASIHHLLLTEASCRRGT